MLLEKATIDDIIKELARRGRADLLKTLPAHMVPPADYEIGLVIRFDVRDKENKIYIVGATGLIEDRTWDTDISQWVYQIFPADAEKTHYIPESDIHGSAGEKLNRPPKFNVGNQVQVDYYRNLKTGMITESRRDLRNGEWMHKIVFNDGEHGSYSEQWIRAIGRNLD